MISTESRFTFTFNENDETQIRNAIRVLEDISKQFEKHESFSEVHLLNGAAHTLDEILRGENF